MYNKTEFYEHSNYKVADITTGLIYLACFVFGVPSNILALYYFTRRRLRSMDIPTFIYTLTTLNDTIISVLVLNSAVTMLRYRDVWLPGICAVQHILFQMSQRMSVFLVAVLSVTRTYILTFPLRRIRVRMVQILFAVLWVLMTCFFVFPPSLGLVQITYHWEGAYCWASPVPGFNASYTWDTLDNTMDCIGLAFPVVPITVSCIVSIYKILVARKIKTALVARKLSSNTNKKCNMSPKNSSRKATCTIIIVTILYIVSNIPLFVNYVLYLITIISLEYPGPIYGSPAMYFYSWNVTAILSTALNASANPIVYLTRFRRYREWVMVCCRPNALIIDPTSGDYRNGTNTSFNRKTMIGERLGSKDFGVVGRSSTSSALIRLSASKHPVLCNEVGSESITVNATSRLVAE